MDAGWGTGRGEVREHFEIRVHPMWLAFYFAHLEVEIFKGIAYPKKYDSYLLILMLFQCHISCVGKLEDYVSMLFCIHLQ